MSFQTPITIAAAINNIERSHYLLPAIQREFEWAHEKIEWLFDSIMRDYPISSFLFWRVEGETKANYKFYKFLKDYRQRYKTHNEEFSTASHADFTAVLDGQQRLTSLYIGLCGSYAYRKPRLHEENSERVYPTRHLHLNILSPLANEEDGRIYEFKFLTAAEHEDKKEKWFRVSEIMRLSDDFEFNKYLDRHSYKNNEFSYRSLSTLKNVIHSKQVINYFLEAEQSLDKALNIFIRINSGGEPLDFSDLIMSIAVANWGKRDARREIHSLVDSVWDKGFTISKDFILKTFLYLHSSDIRFKVTNFSKSNAIEFEKRWESIRDAILSTFDLAKSFGFVDQTLTSKNSLIPIIYYIYHRNIFSGFHTQVAHEQDRALIKRWLHSSLVKRLFSGTSDNVLTQIRKAFTDDISKAYIEGNLEVFPKDRINASIKIENGVSDEFIDEILTTQKEDSFAFSILALLYPHLDYKNNNFHKDHLHPINCFDRLSIEDSERYGWETYNSICNLQLLDGNENMAKQDRPLDEWVTARSASLDRPTFLASQLIPDTHLGIDNFGQFIEARKGLLAAKLKELLG